MTLSNQATWVKLTEAQRGQILAILVQILLRQLVNDRRLS